MSDLTGLVVLVILAALVLLVLLGGGYLAWSLSAGRTCPRCSAVVIDHPWSEFEDALGEHPWVCGACHGADHPDAEALEVDGGLEL